MKKRFFACLLATFAICCMTACSQKETGNVEQGMAAIEEMNYNEALQYFQIAEEAGETSVELYRGKGIALMGQIRYEEALDAFALALKQGGSIPKDIDYDINYYIAVCYYKLGRFDEALERYNAILALKPKAIDAYVQRGTVYLKLNQYTEAMADFDYAISLDKKNYSLYIDIYGILKENDHAKDGESYLQAAMDSNDKNMSNFDKGRMYFYLENYTYARNFFEQARNSVANNKKEELFLLLGQSYEKLNDLPYASTIYLGYLEENESAAIYNQLGMCYFAQGLYQDAYNAFESGVKLGASDCKQELMFNRVVACEYLGDFKKASTLVEEYMKAFPDDENAKREYQFLQTR